MAVRAIGSRGEMEPLTVVASIVAVVAGAFALGTAALLLSPVVIEASCRVGDEHLLAGAVEARAGLGAIVIRRRLGGQLEVGPFGLVMWRSPSRRGRLRRATTALRGRASRSRWRRRVRRASSILRAAVPRWRALLELLRKVVAASRVHMVVEGIIGFEDPADTVVFFELLRLITPRTPSCEVALDRDYFDETLELELTLSTRFIPATLIAIGVAAALRRELRPVLRAAMAGPWR